MSCWGLLFLHILLPIISSYFYLFPTNSSGIGTGISYNNTVVWCVDAPFWQSSYKIHIGEFCVNADHEAYSHLGGARQIDRAWPL